MTVTPVHVEIGSGGTVVVRYGDLVWPLQADAAGMLGRALIAASVATLGAEPPEAGMRVMDAHLPVVAWKTGISNINMESVLMLEVRGGLWISFQLPPRTAQAVGESLSSVATTGGRPTGQLLS
jgi:hypothetical protein